MPDSSAPVAISTGGSGGIGWSIAAQLATEGSVVAADLVPVNTADRASRSPISRPTSAAAAVDAALTDVASRHGRLDLLVNNGIQIHGPTEDHRS